MSEPKAATPSRSGGKVTVMLKHPHGIILKVYEMVEGSEPVMGGGTKTIQVPRQLGESVTLKGTALAFGQVPEHLIVGGYAATTGVDADFFKLWMEQNKDSPLVKNGLIFAHSTEDAVRGQAKEQKGVRSNLEPLTPDTDKRVPKAVKTFKKEAA